MRFIFPLVLGIHAAFCVTHSLKYFDTATSGLPDFPAFVSVGLVDEQPISYYDSNIRRATPRQEWMNSSEGSDYWDRETQIAIGNEQGYKVNLHILQQRFNQTGGVHVVQRMSGCEWDEETGETDGYHQHGYDGEDFLIFDLKNLRWIAPQPQAFITKLRWDQNRALLEYYKHYYTKTCIEWLKKHLENGKSTLKRTVPPTVSLFQKRPSSPVTCHATGFYPRRVMAFWRRDGKVHEEVHEEVLPNPDGTFQTRVRLTVKPEELDRGRWECVVQVAGIQEDFVHEWKRPVPPTVSLFQKRPSSPVTCHATGFYPRRVMAFWRRDGKVHEEVHEEVLPNPDGTFQTRVRLTVKPEELDRGRWECVVQVAGIQEDFVHEWKRPGSPGLIIGVPVVVLLLVIFIISGVVIWRKRVQKGLPPANSSSDGSHSDNIPAEQQRLQEVEAVN